MINPSRLTEDKIQVNYLSVRVQFDQKLPISVRQLVEQSPFTAGDSLFLGTKQTSIYAIGKPNFCFYASVILQYSDSKTGKVLKTFTAHQGKVDFDESCPGPTPDLPRDALFIGTGSTVSL